jgi:membrane-associated phospholipid phosphatase
VETSGPGRGKVRRWSWVHERFLAEARPRTEAQRRHLFVLAGVLAVVGAFGFVVLLVDVLLHTGLSVIDHPLQRAVEHFRSPGLTSVMIFLAVIFGPVAMPIVVAVTVGVWFLVSRHGWRPLLLAGAMLTGVVLAETIAHLVGRPRPPLEDMLFGPDHTASFPSGHVLGVANYLLTGGYLLISRVRNLPRSILIYGVAVAFLITMSFDRVYLGYHWPTDTLASVCLALLELGVVIAIDTWRTVETPEHRSTAETRGPESQPAAGAPPGSGTGRSS